MIGDRFATPPGALRVLQTDGLGPAVSASVTLTSDRPISGVVIFSGSAGVAGVSASGWVNRWTAPVRMDADQGIATGVAVVNRWDVPVEVSLSLPDGTLGAEATIQLPPRGRLSWTNCPGNPPAPSRSTSPSSAACSRPTAICGTSPAPFCRFAEADWPPSP